MRSFDIIQNIWHFKANIINSVKSSRKYSVKKFAFLLAQLIYLFNPVCAQDSFEKEFDEQYQQNITAETLNGVYIPADLDDVIKELNRLSTPEGRSKMASGTEQVVKERLIHGLGKWMLVNWNLFEGSRISHFLKGLGISHPDDMVEFMIVTYYRHLNQLPQEIEMRAKEMQERHKKRLERLKEGAIEIEH